MSKKIILLALMLVTLCSNAQWSSNAAQNTVIANQSGEEVQSKLVHYANGDTYISWFDNEAGNYNVRLQILDHLGNKKMGAQGLLVSNHTTMSWTTDYSLSVDAMGNAIITFQDYRTEATVVNAYKISPSGDFLWGNDGKQLSLNLPGDHYAPQAIITQASNIIITWSYYNSDNDAILCLTKLKPDGSFFWSDSVRQLAYQGNENKEFNNQKLLAAEGDNFILHYSCMGPMYSATDRKLFARKYDASGTQLWESAISNQEGMLGYAPVCLKSDNNGGLIISWADDRDMNDIRDAYIQHLNSDGTPLLQLNGLKIILGENSNHFNPLFDYQQTTHEYFVNWRETDPSQNSIGLYAQKISQNGERLWGDDGKAIIPVVLLRDVTPGQISALSNGNSIIFYSINDSEDLANSTLRCAKLDPTGNFVWSSESKPISTVNSSKGYINIDKDNSAQNWILSWSDNRNGGGYASDIYAQNVNADGILGQDIVAIHNQPTSEKSGSQLLGNYPNPFNPTTTINFSVSKAENIKIAIYNARGQLVKELLNSKISAGNHLVSFDASAYNSGIYYAVMKSAGGVKMTQKMILIK